MRPDRNHLEILDSGIALAQVHMDRDGELLTALASSEQPLLHHYSWSADSLTYGYFVDLQKFVNIHAAHQQGLQMARRPTGGGLLFHMVDLAFSVLVPATHPRFSLNTLQNYALINHAVLDAVQTFLGRRQEVALAVKEMGDHRYTSYCMAHPTCYDVMVDGYKVGGAAQRRTKAGFLHQGSIFLTLPPAALVQDVLVEGAAVWRAMEAASRPLLGATCMPRELKEARDQLRELLAASLSRGLARSAYLS